ncbi:MAG: GntR family transcriptional regulator [Pseudomonadota bacterium]|uniref:GntR family transcriptional regulator n=1 Tax=Polaromonas sp. TaxID=1869339 RepID=UPI00180A3961|nr:GntR family transcriptional regulator [Polaromonas sp.]MBA3593342.1 GntR family transcriptional regulator [Polaromonas sp.]MDQ3271570.1 GntR family transcriptional regulator [Pseudomonadota bacterium]
MQTNKKSVLPKVAAADDSLPLYRQVKRELQKIIEDGHYGPGRPLPSEATLALALQVSIGTLRHAVDELVHEHVLVRRQGKGTFVAPHNRARFMFQFFHVEPRWDPEDDMPQEQVFPDIDCIAFAREHADEAEAKALRIKPGEAVFRIENKLALRGRVVLHDRLTLSAAMFRHLTEKRFSGRPSTIYALFQTDFGITVLRAQERARAVAAGSAVARVLGLPAGTPVMEVHRMALTFGDRPVEYRVSTINTQAHDYVSMLPKTS